MAILSNQAYTLIDVAKQVDGDGKALRVINLLSQENEILTDLPWMEANNGTTHKTAIVTGLPAAFYRQYNQGVGISKATSGVIEDSCAMLEVYSRIDRDLYKLNGEDPNWRLMQERAFISGIGQQMATGLFYNNEDTNKLAYTGLAPRFSTRDVTQANSAANVIDGGGRGTTNTSMWLCAWGPGAGYGIYPKGSVGGLVVDPLPGVQDIPTDDGTGLNRFLRVVMTHFKWDCGLTIEDWRYFVRVANIDTTLLATASAANLNALLTVAVNKLPATTGVVSAVSKATDDVGEPITGRNLVIYINRTLRSAFELQALNKSNSLLQLNQYDGMAVLTWRGIPIRTCDALLNTEATV